MNGYLALRGLGVFPGKFFGHIDEAWGEAVVFQSHLFCYDILTDPTHHCKIVIADSPEIEDVCPLPDDIQSFMPHLKGLVILGKVFRLRPYNHRFSLDYYLRENRVVAFLPDNPELIRDLLKFSCPVSAGIDSKRERAIELSLRGYRYNSDELKWVTTPLEYVWDLTEGEYPKEKYNLVIWDYGVNYRLLRSLKSSGCRLRTLPPMIDPAEIVALHPDAVVIAGGPLALSNLAKIAGKVERLIGIRPLLGVGNGAAILAAALGMILEPLDDSHFGSNIPVEDCQSKEICFSYQAHSCAIKPGSIDRNTTITYLNVRDQSIEGFSSNEFGAMGSFFSSSEGPIPPFLPPFISLFDNELKSSDRVT